MNDDGASHGAGTTTTSGIDPALSGLPPLPPLPRAQPRSRWRDARAGVIEVLATTFTTGGGVAAPTWLLLLPLRWVIAIGWWVAAAAVLATPGWLSGAGVRAFLAEHAGAEVALVSPVVPGLAGIAGLLAWIVAITAVVAGLTLLIGRGMRLGLALGIITSTGLVLLGEVSPHALVLLAQIVLLLAVATGAMGRPRERPWRPRLWMGLLWLLVAVLLGASVRSLDPRLLLDDPAAVLTLIAFVVGATVVLVADHRSRADAATAPPPEGDDAVESDEGSS